MHAVAYDPIQGLGPSIMSLYQAQLGLSYLGSCLEVTRMLPHLQYHFLKQVFSKQEKRRGPISDPFGCMCFLAKVKQKSVSEIP